MFAIGYESLRGLQALVRGTIVFSLLIDVVQGDATDLQALQEAGSQECNAVVVAIGLNTE